MASVVSYAIIGCFAEGKGANFMGEDQTMEQQMLGINSTYVFTWQDDGVPGGI